MKNKIFISVLLVLVLAFGVVVAGCDGGGIINKSVPSWAQGTWYTAASGAARVKIAEITSRQYIQFQVTGYDSSYNLIISEMMRLDCTGVNGDTVEFANGLLVKEISSTQLSVGGQGMWTSIYK